MCDCCLDFRVEVGDGCGAGERIVMRVGVDVNELDSSTVTL